MIVPQNRAEKLKVRQVSWKPIKFLLYDRTANDTLFVQNGNASDYFESEFGLVRSITDYEVAQKGKPKEFRKSTWELYSVLFLPEE